MPLIIRRDLPYNGGFVTFGIDTADLSRYLPQWDDVETPRTDKPVRFRWQTLFAPAESYTERA